MGLIDQRVLYSDNGTINDYSVSLGSFRADTSALPFVAAEDFLYVGSFMPFNHKYIDIGVANDQAASFEIEIWDSRNWRAATDIIDYTSVGGVPLAQSGIVRWTTDRDESWHRELDSFEVTGLESTETGRQIYDMFWVRMSWTADLAVGTTLNYLGHKFSGDADLYGHYPDLNQSALQGQFVSGKTDWESESYVAADTIIRDLRKKQSIFSADQILDYELLREASVHKTAELIFHGLGKSYKDLKDSAAQEYDKAFNIGFMNIDVNQDGRLNPVERTIKTGYMHR